MCTERKREISLGVNSDWLMLLMKLKPLVGEQGRRYHGQIVLVVQARRVSTPAHSIGAKNSNKKRRCPQNGPFIKVYTPLPIFEATRSLQ